VCLRALDRFAVGWAANKFYAVESIEVGHVVSTFASPARTPNFRSEYGIAFAEVPAGPENSKERVLQ
jgi:hypothetical protein